MNQEVKLEVKGHLKVYCLKTGKIFYNDHNALVTNAIEVIRRCLGSSGFIDTITAKKNGNVLATETVSSINFAVAPNNNEVMFKAVFDEASFNDTLDELRLSSSTDGDFSEVLGLSILKDNATQIGIEWTLKIFV